MTPRPVWKSKTLMTVVAASSIVVLWFVMTCRLDSVKDIQIAAFQAISLYAFSSFTIVVCWGLGMKNIDRIFSLKTEALSQASSIAESIMEKREEKIEQIIRTPKASHYDDIE